MMQFILQIEGNFRRSTYDVRGYSDVVLQGNCRNNTAQPQEEPSHSHTNRNETAPIVVLNPHVGSDRTTMVKPLIVGLIPNVALGLNNNSRL